MQLGLDMRGRYYGLRMDALIKECSQVWTVFLRFGFGRWMLSSSHAVGHGHHYCLRMHAVVAERRRERMLL